MTSCPLSTTPCAGQQLRWVPLLPPCSTLPYRARPRSVAPVSASAAALADPLLRAPRWSTAPVAASDATLADPLLPSPMPVCGSSGCLCCRPGRPYPPSHPPVCSSVGCLCCSPDRPSPPAPRVGPRLRWMPVLPPCLTLSCSPWVWRYLIGSGPCYGVDSPPVPSPSPSVPGLCLGGFWGAFAPPVPVRLRVFRPVLALRRVPAVCLPLVFGFLSQVFSTHTDIRPGWRALLSPCLAPSSSSLAWLSVVGCEPC